jgi:NADPH-dependent F420 reductase
MASRLARAGESIIIGSRSKARAQSAAQSVKDLLGDQALRILGCTNAEAARDANVAFVCLPAAGLTSVLTELAVVLEGKIVVEVVNPVRRTQQGFELAAVDGAASAAERVAQLLPKSDVVSAFKTLSATQLLQVSAPLHGDVLVCGDAARAKTFVFELIARLPQLRAVDAGALRNARYAEAATVLLLEINHRYKATTSLQLLGLGRPPH